MFKIKHNTNCIFLILLMLLAFLVLPNTGPFASQSVFHITNDYFNFTKSLLNGQVLYTNLYDHKGLFLFVLYIIPVLISDTSFIGVFLFEGLISAGIVLSCYKFSSYRYGNKIGLILSALVVLILKTAFPSTMLNTEPICIIILFLMLHHMDKESYKNYSIKSYIVFGLLFGVLFWMKYPMIVVLFPFWLFILYYSVKNKNTLLFVRRCFVSFLSFVVFSIPLIIYFIYHNNISKIFDVYFGKVGFEMFSFFTSGSTVEYSAFFIIILSFIGCFCVFKKIDLYYLISLLFVFFLTNNAGVRTYTASFLVVLIVLFIPKLFSRKIGKILCFIALPLFLLLNIPIILPSYNDNYKTIKELSIKYEITNQNILYIGEDVGFGSFSEEPYKLKFQWYPSRIAYEDNDDGYYSILKYAKEKEFEYVAIKSYDYDYTISKDMLKTNRFANIVFAVQQNYEVIETFEYNDGCMTPYYLCRENNN